MKKILIVLSAILLSGCGTMQIADGVHSSRSEFTPYVEKYLQYREQFLGTRDINYPIMMSFMELPPPKVGLCRTSFKKNKITGDDEIIKYIYIDPLEWMWMSKLQREQIVFHELGHCDLDLEHILEDNEIMSPEMIDTSAYRNDRDAIIYRFFHQKE